MISEQLQKKIDQATSRIDVISQSEIWKDIPCYEGKYQVSNYGRVRSLEYHNTKNIKRIGLLKLAEDKKGYIRCALSKHNKLITYKVHRLVAFAFCKNPNNYPQVNHLDGNKKNNMADNLEWCNNSMNQIHAYSHGLNHYHMPTHHPVVVSNKETGEVFHFECIKFAAEFMGVKRQTLEKRLKRNYKPQNYEKFDCSFIRV